MTLSYTVTWVWLSSLSRPIHMYFLSGLWVGRICQLSFSMELKVSASKWSFTYQTRRSWVKDCVLFTFVYSRPTIVLEHVMIFWGCFLNKWQRTNQFSNETIRGITLSECDSESRIFVYSRKENVCPHAGTLSNNQNYTLPGWHIKGKGKIK